MLEVLLDEARRMAEEEIGSSDAPVNGDRVRLPVVPA
jgi:hypothetical protein